MESVGVAVCVSVEPLLSADAIAESPVLFVMVTFLAFSPKSKLNVYVAVVALLAGVAVEQPHITAIANAATATHMVPLNIYFFISLPCLSLLP